MSVPLYETLGQSALEFIANQSEFETCFCSEEKVSSLLDLKDRLKFLKNIVSYDDLGADLI